MLSVLVWPLAASQPAPTHARPAAAAAAERRTCTALPAGRKAAACH